MGIKPHKAVRARDNYEPEQFAQHAVGPDEIDPDAPTHCMFCGDALTPLRRLANRPWCTKERCLLDGRLERTKNWRMVDMHKQGPTVVILDGTPVSTGKRGIG